MYTGFTGVKWHVDHIVPRNSPLVCGLHVHTNLQVIPADENMYKRNLRWPDKPQLSPSERAEVDKQLAEFYAPLPDLVFDD
jgi:hypothetical protein